MEFDCFMYLYSKRKNMQLINDQSIANKIYLVRNQKIMLDRDLAELYEVETKRLKEAVRRNIDRFPEDFMFEMTENELENWRSQFVTSNTEDKNWRTQFASSNSEDENLRTQIASSSLEESNLLKTKDKEQNWGGSRYKPFCFTEQGVAMLSSVLNSERAIKVNIQIIRLFTKMREIILTNKDILLKLEQLEYKSIRNEENIEVIFETLNQLLTEPEPKRNPIGFKIK